MAALPAPARKKKIFTAGILTFWLVAASVTSLHADIYRYVDDNGVMHFTNAPTSERYELFVKSSSKPPAADASDAAAVPAGAPQSTPVAAAGIAPFYGTDAYDDYISLASQCYGVPFCLVKSIIKAESNFNSRAVSEKGAQGLMQLMPSTARLMNVSDPFDPYQNIMGGTRYFRMMLNRFNGKVKYALAGYNAGPGNVEIHKGVPPFKETRNYISRVAKFYRQLKWGEYHAGKPGAVPGKASRNDEEPVSIQPIRIKGGLTQLTPVR